MDSQIKQFEASITRHFVVHIQSGPNGTTLFCNDLAGNFVGSRIFSARQLKNAALVSLALADFRMMLSTHTDQVAFPST